MIDGGAVYGEKEIQVAHVNDKMIKVMREDFSRKVI